MTEIKLLDHGFCRLEEFAGSDDSVVRAARVSYGARPRDEEKDKKLIAYMWNNEHGTPFEHNHFIFHIKAPIFVFRQWHRSRIGVSYNELSARYSEMVDEFHVPQIWRAQDTKNKQGSVAADLKHKFLTKIAKNAYENAMQSYRSLLTAGVAKEMARFVLPVSLFSEMYFSCNARSLMNFIQLRSDKHAQAETRQYSHAMAHFLKEKMPWTWEAFYKSLLERKNRDYSELGEFLDKKFQVTA